MRKNYMFAAAAVALLAGGAAKAEDGITFYGTVDVGISYDTHGQPNTTVGSTSSDYLVSKGGNKSIFTLSPGGLSQSSFGLRGAQDLGESWTGLFRLETGFNPLGGNIVDGGRSLVNQNGVPLKNQSAVDDSSQNGQAFTKAAYVGIANDRYGTLTAGRQNTLQADTISVYDPMLGSYAFSVIGFSGAYGGNGSTEDLRWDNSVKYLGAYGPARLGLMYQFGGTIARNDTGWAVDLGGDYAGLSVDAVYSHKKDLVSGASLSAAQLASILPGGSLASLGLSPSNTISGTVSDNDAYSFAAKYKWDPLTFSGGYQYMRFANPSSPLANGAVDLGGYTLLTNNTSFTRNKIVQISFVGVRYAATSKLDLATAWYHVDQNGFAASSPSGSENAFSLMADYHFSKKFDAYAGLMYSQVIDGLANGYLHNNNIDPTIGLRYSF